MPLGLNRSGDFRNGTSVDLTIKQFGNPVNWTPSPAHFGNAVPPSSPDKNSNPVTWAPDPVHFGNTIS